MKVLIKTKLLEDRYCELREYELFKSPLKVIHCKGEDYKTCSHEEDRYMYLSLAQQKKGKVVNTLQSKFPPYSYYRMYKFLWKPEPLKIDDRVDIAPEAWSRLAKEWRKHAHK